MKEDREDLKGTDTSKGLIQTEKNIIKRTDSHGKYAVRGARIECSRGDGFDVINLPLCHGVYSGDEPLVNIKDMEVGKNICNGFGVCTTPEGMKISCKEEIKVLINWINTKKTRFHVDGEEALTTGAFTMCGRHGGSISVVSSGQTALYSKLDDKRSHNEINGEGQFEDSIENIRLDEKIVGRLNLDKSIEINKIDIKEKITASVEPVGISRESIASDAKNSASKFLIILMKHKGGKTLESSVFSAHLSKIGDFTNIKDYNAMTEAIFTFATSNNVLEFAVSMEFKSPFYLFELDSNYNIRKNIYIIKNLDEYNFLIKDKRCRDEFVEMLNGILDDPEFILENGYDEGSNILIYNLEVKLFIEKVININSNYDKYYKKYIELRESLDNSFDEINSFEKIYFEA